MTFQETSSDAQEDFFGNEALYYHEIFIRSVKNPVKTLTRLHDENFSKRAIIAETTFLLIEVTSLICGFLYWTNGNVNIIDFLSGFVAVLIITTFNLFILNRKNWELVIYYMSFVYPIPSIISLISLFFPNSAGTGAVQPLLVSFVIVIGTLAVLLKQMLRRMKSFPRQPILHVFTTVSRFIADIACFLASLFILVWI